jgi:predicted Zn-dependent protease with MMP-like domain
MRTRPTRCQGAPSGWRLKRFGERRSLCTQPKTDFPYGLDERDPTTVNPELFRKNVAKALEDLPDEFRAKMDNVEIIVEEFPDRETIESVGVGSRWNLLGLYVGVPITERSVFSVSILPERIYLYRRPILRAAGPVENVVDTIRDVFIHEVGHHFGFDDDELAELAGQGE